MTDTPETMTDTPETTPDTPQSVRLIIPREWYLRPWLLGLFLVFGLVLLYTIRMWTTPLIVGFLLTALVYSTNERLVPRLRGRRPAASCLSIIVLAAVVLVPLYVIIRISVVKLQELQLEIEPVLASARLQFEAAVADAGAGTEVAQLLDEITMSIYMAAGQIGLGILGGTVNLLLYGVIVVLILFFLLRDTPVMLQAARDLSPIGPGHVDFLARRFRYVTIGVLKGVVVVALVQSAIGGLTLALVGVPGVWLWTILMAVMSLIPLFGTWMIMYPLAIIEIARGNVAGGVFIILVTLLVITTVDNVLRPILVGKQAKMHTLIALLATVGGLFVFGAIGVFIGPIIAAMFIALLELYREELMPPEDAA